MALPAKLGAALAADMSKSGLTKASKGSPAPEEPGDGPEEDGAAGGEDGDGVGAIVADIDALVPGLGKLVHELVDRLRAEDEEQDQGEA